LKGKETMDDKTPVSNINYVTQFNLAKSVEKNEKHILDILKIIMERKHKKSVEGGLLIIYGDFEPVVHGVVQMLSNPFQGQLLYINDENFVENLVEYMENDNNDGAILVNSDGQVLGANVYLIVENPVSKVPEQTGTRHIAASSFSIRKDVYSSYVLSETRNSITMFKGGEIVERILSCDDKLGKLTKKINNTK